MIAAVKLGAIVGAAYAAGRFGGAWVATKVNLATNEPVKLGIQVATGVTTLVVLSVIFR